MTLLPYYLHSQLTRLNTSHPLHTPLVSGILPHNHLTARSISPFTFDSPLFCPWYMALPHAIIELSLATGPQSRRVSPIQPSCVPDSQCMQISLFSHQYQYHYFAPYSSSPKGSTTWPFQTCEVMVFQHLHLAADTTPETSATRTVLDHYEVYSEARNVACNISPQV